MIKLGIVMDPIANINIKKDSSFAMLLEAQRRGYEIHYMEMADLYLNNGEARARTFANRLHGRFGVKVTLHDERLSTVEARAGLFERGGFRALNKGSVDSASAVVILESFFEQHG